MQRAALACLGTQNFTSFAAADGSHKTAERTIHTLDIERRSDVDTWIKIRGTAFMKNMVRIMVGTLVDIGRGHLDYESMIDIINARDRQAAGPTAPPQGLELRRIVADYED